MTAELLAWQTEALQVLAVVGESAGSAEVWGPVPSLVIESRSKACRVHPLSGGSHAAASAVLATGPDKVGGGG